MKRERVVKRWGDPAPHEPARAGHRTARYSVSELCSTSGPAGPACPVIAARSMRHGAARRRPEQRSNDGQLILTGGPAGWKPASDLLVCRAPLRNRTVDLLLTMYRRTVLLSLVGPLTWQNASAGQHPQAPDGLSRAPFATQSATHFDLLPSN